MKILCLYPRFSRTYWGQENAMKLAGRKAVLPPLGLLTVAALLPKDWDVRLVDLNVRSLEGDELAWADVVFLSGMLVQREALLDLAAQARAAGKIVVMGGPVATTSPEVLMPHADCVVSGEAEELMGPLCEALAVGRSALPAHLSAPRRPDVRLSPTPRYDLLDVNAYASMGVQWSRGCPFNCEFCDIIEVFGRKPRMKPAEQLCHDLDAIYATGFRGSVFLADDNLVGNRLEAIRLFERVGEWMARHRYPFTFYGEASINLAACDDLMAAMVEAGFDSVFVGIETPSEEALREAHKAQNLAVDLHTAVEQLVRSGLDVLAGFIVGFDSDDAAAIERQRRWVSDSCIPQAMVGILTALPGTQLERRLIREGRLVQNASGETFGRANFRTKMDEVELLQAYARLIRDIYQPEAYFERVNRALELRPRAAGRFTMPWAHALACVLRSILHQGVLGKYRRAYWRYLWRVVRKTPHRIARGFSMAIAGEHMIRYTAEDVLPRLAQAIAQASAESASGEKAAA
jgi:radical SAM superfamily enzyme YgiQ (UPF0313 family)